MLLSEKQKIDSGFFLFEAEQKTRKDKFEKRQLKKIRPIQMMKKKEVFIVVAFLCLTTKRQIMIMYCQKAYKSIG